ncbi:crossover junction endodeoxyribonuclease RuvC [Scytonema sp. NUACC26]|uniref:crossover junction endodeoxyribonuclease RuvC n=1 Tax=Scytonema sp. NUACC26 TaxID=3140176 RepID=UPI0034DC13A0
MLIFGLDPGVTNIGYSIYSTIDKQVLESSEITAKQHELEDKLVHVYNKFNELIEKYQFKMLSYEQPVFVGRGTTGERINRVLGVILLLCRLNGIQTLSYTAPQLKKKTTGNGKADKHDVESAVAKYFNINNKFSTNHASDSLGAIMCYLLDKGE